LTLDVGDNNKLAFSMDDHRIATAGEDGFVAIFEPLTGKELNLLAMVLPKGCGIHQYESYSSPAYSVAFSHKGDLIATGDNYGFLRVWDITENPAKPKAQIYRNYPLAICFSKDDSEVLMAGGDCWNYERQLCKPMDFLPEDTPNLAFRPWRYNIHLTAVSRRMQWEATFNRHPADWQKCSRLNLSCYRRPPYWWGFAWLPEFWLTFVLGCAFIWSILRDRRLFG